MFSGLLGAPDRDSANLVNSDPSMYTAWLRAEVRYSITGGNRDGLFTIDQRSGTITLAAALDFELSDRHDLVVTAEGGGEAAHALVHVRVGDVNDNPPVFLRPDPRLTVIEEDDRDLPATIAKVEAVDADLLDEGRLVFRVTGDGVEQEEGSGEAFFTVHARTGDLIQLRALDRDPPQGRGVWRLRVEVRDGQWWGDDQNSPTFPRHYSPSHPHRQASWGRQEPQLLPDAAEEALRGWEGGGVFPEPATGDRNRGAREERHASPPRADSGTPVLGLVTQYKPSMAPSMNGADRPRPEKRHPTAETKYKAPSVSENQKDSDDKGGASGQDNSYGMAPHERQMRFKDAFDAFTPAPHLQDIQGHQQQQRPTPANGYGRTTEAFKSQHSEKPITHKSPKLPPPPPWDRRHPPGTRSAHHATKAEGEVAEESHHIAQIRRGQNKKRNPTQPRPRQGTEPAIVPPRQDVLDAFTKGEKEADSSLHFSDNVSESPGASYTAGSSSRDTRGVRLSRDANEMTFTSLGDILTEDYECEDVTVIAYEYDGVQGDGGRERRVHVVETEVTVVVKDINDNAPVFPNATMIGHVQENGAAGAAVVVVSAWDADDATDGSNARLTYAIEKNVVDEASGAAIFSMESDTGLVRTARCCLDRETTPEYRLQVVAADGGGLKGTGTVVVRVMDENDNPPRLARRHWELKVDETPPEGPPPTTTLLELTAADRDARNAFLYRVVPRSGRGWENFGMRSVGSAGQLFARKNLDYELESHRRGFRFQVQVTDQGPEGWEDLAHVDSAWVTVHLRDVNDNPPVFSRPHAHVTVREDAVPGTPLAALPARDPDAQGGQQGVDYRLEGGWGSLMVDTDGSVSLWRQLDREAPDGATGKALVVAVDRGVPPLSATATLTITVADVNDCPPRLLPPTILHVMEGGPPTRLGILKVTDPDVWALGHGPPFTLSLAPTNPPHVLSLIKLKFDPRLDSGRGGAELWTAGALDREQHRELSVAVRVSDAQGLAATHRLTVLVDDLNDNPMKPAAKSVYLWKTQGGGSDAPLGRVFVEDPDDWDLGDKEFEWVGPPHPLFTLHPRDGTIFASSQIREGRYDLQFSVSDRAWRQRGVAANVTVMVRVLTPEALAHAAPISLTPTTPTDLSRGWSPSTGGGGLGSLLKEVLAVLNEPGSDVEVVSVYGGCGNPDSSSTPITTPAPTPAAPVLCPSARPAVALHLRVG
ncbi:hypothetical protein O3P69_001579 [Scylla paramamosain]|uniref:Cadherin domain-containing protein n=1 Tax=Scylla paramamosain TaxID=85552 RepID=A0AAW0UY83_SCYPA